MIYVPAPISGVYGFLSRSKVQFAAVSIFLITVASASATILSVTGNDTLVGVRATNLIANGSFEADSGVVTNGSYWATGTTLTPTMSLTAWTASGQSNSYAIWGSDGLGGINNSAAFPHGTNGLYFGASIMAGVSPLPVEATNGLVSFPSPPVISPKPTDGPVTLQQTVSNLNPLFTYVLDFWTSGEEIGSGLFPADGFFGLNITGEPTLYFAAPSGNGPIGNSQRYQVYFAPSASTVTFEWINWGHYVATNGMSDELVLDDVILNRLTNAPVPIDCSCLTNLTLTCPATLPDFCQLTNCFTTNMLPGSCTQSFPPGMPLSVGTYPITVQVLDLQSNVWSCIVTVQVIAPVPAPNLTVNCPTNKSALCGSGWTFDEPVVLTACCGVTVNVTTNYSTGNCPKVWTRGWQILDGCGNLLTCEQKVTEVDTTPPGTQCGQNLVPNGGFENFTNCPNAISQFDFAAPWFTPTAGTSDYYNSCSVNNFLSTPTNLVGVQTPLSGQAYAGAVLWSVYGLGGPGPASNYREYLEVPLLATLASGQRYQVSFYVSRADECRYAVAEIGARFSSGPLVDLSMSTNFNFAAHIENPSTNLLASTNSWTLVQGVYTAIGGENHLTIGNFRSDVATTYATFPPGSFPDYAYYYFDDVSVVALCTPPTNKTVQCGEPWQFDELLPFDNCSGGDVTNIVSTVTNGTCPQSITRSWFLTDQCSNTNAFTQTVTILDTNPPVLLCSPGANLAPNPSFENYSYCPWSYSQVPAAGPWFNPTIATPDYFNACTTFPIVSTPTNVAGSQSPLSGQAYVGAFVYSLFGTNPVPGYREYIEAPLLAPLVAGMTYQVSFRVSLADISGWAIAEVGAHFSTGPILGPSTQGPLSYIPQVVNPPTNLLTSTNSWMLVQGTFTAAGGENHITLGNFRNDALTTAVMHLGTNSPSPNFRDFAYYYYDNVAVVPLCSFTNKTVACDSPWTFDTPQAYDTCSGTQLTTTVVSTVTNGPCPLVATRIWQITDLCSNSIMATQMVTIVDTQPPIPMCAGTNLVPNGQFESYTQCPTNLDLSGLAAPWYMPSVGTSDYFNTCALPSSFVSVPTNFAGSQMPYSGQGYAGLYAYALPYSYREYLQVPLVSPLVATQSYPVSFRVSLADNSGWAVAELGAHFSVGQVLSGNDLPLPVTPQVVNPSTNLLTSSNSWMLVQGSYTAAGGETHLTLGNFFSNNVTTIVPAGGYEASLSYYYIDDVQVIGPCAGIAPVKVVPCGATWEFDTITGYDQCSGANITITNVTVTNSICPLSVTRTWTLTDPCNNTTNISQTVTVTNNSPFIFNCACLQDALMAQLTTNACSAVIPLVTLPTNSPCISNACGTLNVSQAPPPGTPVGPGTHNITLSVYRCGGVTNQCVVTFQVNPPAPTITCPATINVIGCSNNSAIVNFAATATGHVGTIVYSPPSGSVFPLGTNLVSCTATSSCGGVAVCYFNVIVRPVPKKFPCFTKVIGIITFPPPVGRIIHQPDFPGGGLGVDIADIGGTEGIRFDIGPAEKFTFSTMLDFDAPTNASFELRLPPGGSSTTSTPLVRFERSCVPQCGWNVMLDPQIVSEPGATFRSIAISTNGQLFSSFTHTAAELQTNILANLAPMGGATNGLVTVTLDCRTREITLDFGGTDWTPNATRKGWDGCIYGNHPRRGSTSHAAARLIITPLVTNPPPAITEFVLATTNLTSIAFDNPSITMSRRKWSDGHVTLMKAYDDGAERGMEFYALGDGGGVNAEFGHAESFSLRMTSLDTNGLPLLEQQFAIRGWPPGTTTNRPPPPMINLRLAPDTNGLGVNCGAWFTEWGVSNVTLQLWNGTTLVAETNHVPATPGGTLLALGNFPGILGCPGIGVLSLSDTNPMVVTGGLVCGTLGCVGTELRIIAELTSDSTPPTAYTDLDSVIGQDMDYLIHRLQTTPAVTPAPLQVWKTSNGVTLDWPADGFRLQVAESVSGPWYDVNVQPPVSFPIAFSMRYFRLQSE